MERRRRLITRTLPLAIIASVAFVAGAVHGAPGSPEKDAAERFTTAWEERDFGAMYRELNPASKRATSIDDFVTAYRDAAGVATLRSLEAGSPGDASEVGGVQVVPVAIDVQTVAFGPVEGDLRRPL